MSDNQSSGFSFSSLEPVGKFIGTYGLAVFLVVYYAIWLYPDSFKERGAWITKIEELRRSINPEDKPMSTSQTESILDYVTDLYFLNVQSELPFNTYSYSTPGGGIIGGGMTFSGYGGVFEQTGPEGSIILNGLGFQFYVNPENPTEEALRVTSILKESVEISSKETVVSTYEPMLNKALDNALKSSSRLRLFNFENETLYELWNEIVSNNESDFKQELLHSFAISQEYLQLGSLRSEIRHKLKVSPPDVLSIQNFERPNQVLNRYRKKMKNQWLNQIKGAGVPSALSIASNDGS